MRAPKTKQDMKDIATMLACPHQWGETLNVTIVEGKKRRNAEQAACHRCGTHRIKYEAGTGALISPDGISDKPGQ